MHPLSERSDHLLLEVKAVPGASRDGVAGRLGDRLKVRVSAPPEDGKANEAICAVVAARLGLRPRQVTVQSGRSSTEKSLRIEGWMGSAAAAAEALGL